MRLRNWCVLLGFLIAGVSASHPAAAQLSPAVGRFLVATPAQQGFFSESVILLIAYGPDGALGIVINRPTRLELARALPDPKVLHGRTDLLYVGGPVSLDDLTLLVRARNALPESVAVLRGVYVSESLTTLRAAVGQKLAADHFRAYAGYAGWAPGQLGAELARGAWTVAPADAEDVFTARPADLWKKLSRQGNTLIVQVAACAVLYANRCREPMAARPLSPGPTAPLPSRY